MEKTVIEKDRFKIVDTEHCSSDDVQEWIINMLVRESCGWELIAIDRYFYIFKRV